MGKYAFLILGIGFFTISFFMESMVSNRVGNSMVWVFRGMGIWFVVLPVFIFLGTRYKHKKEEKRKSFFQRNGRAAMATLISASRTGVFLNKVPQFEFEFRISSNGQEEFITHVKKYIRFVDLSEISEGMKIPAYIHPENEGKIFLMWEEAGIGKAF